MSTWKNFEKRSIAKSDSTRKFSSSRKIVSAMHTSGIVYRIAELTRSTSVALSVPKKMAFRIAAKLTIKTMAILPRTTTLRRFVTR